MLTAEGSLSKPTGSIENQGDTRVKPDVAFNILEIHTNSFPMRTPGFKNKKSRFLLVSVTDGKSTKNTTPLQIEGQSLRWNGTLSGFTLSSTSHLTLHVFEKNKGRSNLLATFLISYEKLCSSPSAVLQVQSASSKSPSSEISITFSERNIDSSSQVIQGDLATQMTNTLRLAPGIGCISNGAGNTLNSGVEATSMDDFLKKWKDITDRLGFFSCTMDQTTRMDSYDGLYSHISFGCNVFSLIPSEQISSTVEFRHEVMSLVHAMESIIKTVLDSLAPTRQDKLSQTRIAILEHMMDFGIECGYFFQFYTMDANHERQRTNAIEDLQNQAAKLFCAFDGDVSIVNTNIRVVLESIESSGTAIRGPGNVGQLSAKTFRGKWEDLHASLGVILVAADTLGELYPHVKLAWSITSFTNTSNFWQISADKNVLNLLNDMQYTLSLVSEMDTYTIKTLWNQGSLRKTLVQLLERITECSHFIQSQYTDVKFWKRFTQHVIRDMEFIIGDYRQSLGDIHNQLLQGITSLVQQGVIKYELDQNLRTLPYGIGTIFNAEKGCLPGTRTKFLRYITNWFNTISLSSPKAFILLGQAGTGKTTIAHEIARRFYSADRLTTSYFFTRENPSSREPYRFFTTLARDLCRRYPQFKAALSAILKNNPHLLSTEHYPTLLESLIIEPLRGLVILGPVVVVIDALDQSGGTSFPWDPFHIFLMQNLTSFPSNFRIFITTRPEEDIVNILRNSSTPNIQYMEMDDAQVAGGLKDDIGRYIRTKLDNTFIGDAKLREWAMKAEDLFAWASFTCHYIVNSHPNLISAASFDRMQLPNPLDDLYTSILRQHEMDKPRTFTQFSLTMGLMFAAFEPLSIDSLIVLVRHATGYDGEGTIYGTVKLLASLLRNVSFSTKLPILPIHSSFRDFLTDQNRSHKFYVNMDNTHKQLAYATLRTMQEKLHFNMCQLETSYHLNSEVPDLNNRIENCISSALSYSCRFWAEHLALVSESEVDVKLLQCIRGLMEEKFLFWLEALSLQGELGVAITALSKLRSWLGRMQDKNDTNLDLFIKDAIAFVRYFQYPMSQSTPHIYLSALPFAPESSLVANLFLRQFPRTFNVKHGRLTQWPPMAISVPNGAQVSCIAFSANGMYVAAGLRNGSSYVWNTSTETKCNASYVIGDVPSKFATAIALSHDGTCLASGLSDGTIQIWNLEAKGVCRKGPALTGHTKFVSALTFSQDGLVVSGSGDRTVRSWDITAGGSEISCFVGHQNPVWAVSFAPNRGHIISRSGLRTVQVHDMRTVQKIINLSVPVGSVHSTIHYSASGILKRVSDSVQSTFTPSSWKDAVEEEQDLARANKIYSDYWAQAVAFSHDGKFAATCSPSHVHVWHATGLLAGGPFSCDGVLCLAFLENGQQIAAGTSDGRVCIWNIEIPVHDKDASTPKINPASATLFPNCKEVMTGYKDGTVQVINASNGQVLADMKTSLQPINLVAISMNGNWLAAVGHQETVVHIWNWSTSQELTRFEDTSQPSGKSYITTIAFSPELNDVLALGTSKGWIRIWNAMTSETLVTTQIEQGRVTCLAFLPSVDIVSPTRIRLAVGLDSGQMFIWDTRAIGPFLHHDVQVKTLAALDAEHIVSLADDYSLCLWDYNTVKEHMLLRKVEGIRSWLPPYRLARAVLAKDGRKVVLEAKDYMVLVLKLEYNHGGPSTSVISLQASLLLAGHSDYVTCMDVSCDGRYLSTVSYDHTIRVWDLQAALERKLIPNSPDSVPFDDETIVDNDGWAVHPNGEGPPLRLMWVPEVHRTLHRPSNLYVIGQNDTKLGLENFAHGNAWSESIWKSEA